MKNNIEVLNKWDFYYEWESNFLCWKDIAYYRPHGLRRQDILPTKEFMMALSPEDRVIVAEACAEVFGYDDKETVKIPTVRGFMTVSLIGEVLK